MLLRELRQWRLGQPPPCEEPGCELVSLGVRFLSPNESVDTGTETPMSKFLLLLFVAFAG
jgi:hypothetical protein